MRWNSRFLIVALTSMSSIHATIAQDSPVLSVRFLSLSDSGLLAYRLCCSHIVRSDTVLGPFPCDSRNLGEDCLRPFRETLGGMIRRYRRGEELKKREFLRFFFFSLFVFFVLPRSIPTSQSDRTVLCPHIFPGLSEGK